MKNRSDYHHLCRLCDLLEAEIFDGDVYLGSDLIGQLRSRLSVSLTELNRLLVKLQETGVIKIGPPAEGGAILLEIQAMPASAFYFNLKC